MRLERAAAALVLAAGLALSAKADAQDLPASVRSALASLPPAERARVLQRQARLQAMPANERARLRQRMAAWDARPHAERRARREAWLAWEGLPPLERARLRAAAAAFQALPAADQQALRERFEGLDESERHGWQLGPTLGAEFPQLHALFALVPPAQREGLLGMLRAMTPGERADLAVLAQRTPPQEREALRRELASTAVEQRAQWLRRRVDP